MPRNLGLGATAVLHALARGHNYGFDIMEATGLSSGSIYPALDRLETDGLAVSTWEDADVARAQKRPSRRYFVITPVGRTRLHEALTRYPFLAPLDGPAGPASGGRRS